MEKKESIHLELKRSLLPLYTIGTLLIFAGAFILYYTITHKGERSLFNIVH